MAIRGIVEVLKTAGKGNKRAFSNNGLQILLAFIKKLQLLASKKTLRRGPQMYND